ncbi:MAG TPA: hypothetical protein VNH19_22195 [Candidatus Limnocylindrales bacterium]|nr:hypothetical protein [Candidatus Limnocylindrales bacterium]
MAVTRQQKELIALAALVVIAGSIWYFYMGRPARTNAGFSAADYSPIKVEDYFPIFFGLDKARGTEYKSAGRNIFVMTAVPVDVAQKGPTKAPFMPQGPMPPPPPPPAQLPMVFFGYGMLPAGGTRQAFLKEETGDEIHIVSEGDVVMNHIRILHIGNDKIDFEDTNTGQKGSRSLEVAPAA